MDVSLAMERGWAARARLYQEMAVHEHPVGCRTALQDDDQAPGMCQPAANNGCAEDLALAALSPLEGRLGQSVKVLKTRPYT